MEWNWPMGSSVGWAGWAGPAGQLAKEKIRKKKTQKKNQTKSLHVAWLQDRRNGMCQPITPKSCAAPGCCTHCPLPNRQARVHNVQYSRVHVSDAFRLPSSATHPKHRAPRAAAG